MGDGRVDDPAEGGTAAAAINTVQLICGAFGAGLAGVIVNMTAAVAWRLRGGFSGLHRPRCRWLVAGTGRPAAK